MRWDPTQYAHYADERSRPFYDLVARVQAETPGRVVDLGCGPGELTTSLAHRWPGAEVIGIDSSPEMIAKADGLESPVRFEVGDIAIWQPDESIDVMVSNAAFQWVPGHRELLTQWLNVLPTGAWVAWQVPGNFGSPSHTLMREVAESPRWVGQLGGVLRHEDAVHSAPEYASLLLEAGWTADAWETRYLHILSGPEPVLEWVRGTGLRPVLAVLDEHDPMGADHAEFEAEYAERLRSAYPSTEHGTILEFRRIFAVGQRR